MSLLLVLLLGFPARGMAAGNAVVDSPGCQANTLPANDDGSTGLVYLPFTLDFFGTDYSSLYVNNNGNVTFDAPMSTYTPFDLTASTPPIIAPFFADVDTRGAGSGQVTYGTTTFQGHEAFCVEWPYVGYYAQETDKLNDFELLLVQRNDVAPGDFDIVFNYDQIQWETGDASGGSDGLGGTSAGVGFSAGDNNASDFYQLNGSLVNGAFLDSNPATGLVNNDVGSSVPGRYIFHITGTPGTGGGGLGLQRPWPAAGYGYFFFNKGLSTYLSDAGLAPSAVLNHNTMSNVFSDWTQVAGTGSAQNAELNSLYAESNGGVCYGLALSAGRFDSGLAVLADPTAGRSDPIWARAGTGPSATMNLPEPGYSGSSTFDTQFLSRIEQDFVSQFSTEVNSSLQQQYYAYADPTSGFTSLENQLESVMGSGTDNYSALSTPGGNGFAEIILKEFEPSYGSSNFNYNFLGHAVLAYSAETLSDGDLEIDVWDNNFPDTPYAIDVQPDGEWTYNAPYTNGDFQGTMSLSGQPGDTLGELAALPLYDPIGLHFDPPSPSSGVLGSGSLVDVAAGETITSVTDSSGDPVDVEPVVSNAAVGDDGQIVDLPSGSGNVIVVGTDPSLDVRSQDAYMTAESNTQQQLNVNADPASGTIGAGTSSDVSVSRGASEVTGSGVGQLTYGSDGSVSSTGDSGAVNLQVVFESNGSDVTATLYSGPAPSDGNVQLSASQVSAAEQQALNPQGQGIQTTAQPSPAQVTARVARAGKITVSGHAAKVKLTCTNTGGSSCRVAGVITVTETVKGGRVIAVTAAASRNKHAAKAKRKTIVISRSAASIPAGRTATLKLHLNGTGVRLLRTGNLHARLKITFGAQTVTVATVTFKRRQ